MHRIKHRRTATGQRWRLCRQLTVQCARAFVFGALLAAVASLAPAVFAQQEQQSQQPGTPLANAIAEDESRTTVEPKTNLNAQAHSQSGTSNDRLFNVLPNFLTLEDAEQLPPLGSEEKFKVVARGTFDYVQIPWYGFLAGISQAQNSEPGYGHGAAGYGKRFGSAFADGTIENYMTGAILPSLLHQDPRFFQSSQGGFWRRTGYAVSRIVVTRTDSG